MNKKISIVIPIYKVEKYLDKCVESVLCQTYKNLEIILVDDGSPDNCPKKCDEWAKKDNRIKVIHKANGGLSDARNCGIDNACGDYIMFVDSDDYLTINALEKLTEILERNNADFVMGGVTIFKEDTTPQVEKSNEREQLFEGEQVIENIYKSEIPFIMTAWAKLYKISIFENLRYEVGKIHEDEFMYHKFMAKTRKFVYTSFPVYNYLVRSSGITGSVSEKNLEHTIEAFIERFKFMEKNFPNRHAKNVNMHLSNLRALYVSKRFNAKYKKLIKEEFKKTYKEPVKKIFLNRLFNFSTLFYKFVYKIVKNQKKERK